MTFSSKIKQEISTTECTRAEYLSELSGIIRTSAEIKIYNIKVQTENKFVANRIFGLFKLLFDINLNISLRKNYNFKKNEIYVLELKRDTLKVLRDLGIINDKNELALDSVINYDNIILASGTSTPEEIVDQIIEEIKNKSGN